MTFERRKEKNQERRTMRWLRILNLVAVLFLIGGSFPSAVAYPKDGMDLTEAAVHDYWRNFEKPRRSILPRGNYPYRDCFERTAERHGLSLPLLLAVARGESDFNPRAKSEAECYGIMQIKWPGTAKDLGITVFENLFDPCINIAAGGRYLAQLLRRFDGDTYLALAAYNYGPRSIGRALKGDGVPEGARWYAAYIHNHLRYVETETYEAEGGRLLVLEFNKSYAYALRMRQRFEEMTRGLAFEIFKSDHYTYDLYITYKPGKREETIRQLDEQTGIQPVALRQRKRVGP